MPGPSQRAGGKQHREPQARKNFCLKSNVPGWVRFPPTSPGWFFSATRPPTRCHSHRTFANCPIRESLGQVGGAMHCGGVDIPTLSGLSGDACCLPVTVPGCSVGLSLCRTDICTSRGSLGRIKGDTGNLEMVSVWAGCGDRTRGGGTSCLRGTRSPRRQLWNLRTSAPSRRNRRAGLAAGTGASRPITARGFIFPRLCGDQGEGHRGQS